MSFNTRINDIWIYLLVIVFLVRCGSSDAQIINSNCNHTINPDGNEGNPSHQLLQNVSFDERVFESKWRVQNDYMDIPVCDSEDSFLLFGCADWRDYEFRFRVCRRNQAEGLVIVLENTVAEKFRLNLGADDNSLHKLERETAAGGKQIVQKIKGGTVIGRWITVRLRCRGTKLQVWLNNKLVFDFSGSRTPIEGMIRLGARNEGIRLRNFRATSLDGRVLFRGLPTPAKHWFSVGQATIELVPDQNTVNKTNLRIKSLRRYEGIEQRHLDIRGGEPIRGSLQAYGQATDGLLVRLIDGPRTLAEATISVPADWGQEIPIELASKTDMVDASLQILTLGKATVWLDEIRLIQNQGALIHPRNERP